MRPSNDILMKRQGELIADLQEVSQDDLYSGQNTVLTFKALPVFLRRVAENARFVAVLRVENYHQLLQEYNAQWLYDSIRRLVNLRAPQILLRSRGLAENEILFVLSENPEEIRAKLLPIAANDGLEISFGYVTFSGNVQFDYKRIGGNHGTS